MSNLRRRLPPLGTLVVFEAAFRLRSFSRAGEEVFLSQASVSRQIKQLETNLAVKLFERQRHDVLPTKAGEQLATTVYLTLNELASTADRLRLNKTDENNFTICSDISLGRHLIAPYLDDFQARFPELKFRLLSSYTPIEQVTEDFDLGFQIGRWAEDKFDIEPIADDAVFPVCSPVFASQLPAIVDAVELSKQPLLHLEDVGRDWIDWRSFLTTFRVRSLERIEGTTFTSYQVCLEAAESGRGIALGWYRSVKKQLDEGKLVRVSNLLVRIPDSINVYRRKLARSNPIADQFVKKLRTNIEPIDESFT